MATRGVDGTKKQPGSYLVIPYYTGDQGSRPLPPSELFWMCPSINVDGSPYAGQQLQGGQSVELTLDAINYGALTAPTVCLFFWANPTTNFTSATVQLIGQTVLSLPTYGLTTTPPVLWTVPEGTPKHICLLAEITTPGDPAPQDYAAATDRHFGQQNVHVTSGYPGGQIRVGFVMANGSAMAAHFRLEATDVLMTKHALRHLVAGDTVLREAENLNVRIHSGEERRIRSIEVALVAGEVVELELSARVPRDAVLGSTIIIELAQYQDRERVPVGGLGVVVHVA